MTTSFATLVRCLVLAGVVLSTSVAQAAFVPYVIRNSGGGNPPVIQNNNTYVPNATEFVISEGGQKAAWGSNDVNGATIQSLTDLSITRYDDPSRFTAGSGPAVAPYFNIWITDGMQYAVLANEPSNPSFQPLFETTIDGYKQYSLSFSDIQDEPVKVYETANGGTNNTWVHAALGKTGMGLTFADVANFVIEAPDAAYITGGNGVGTGAPRELGTNVAYGFNWVFGDTLSNYVSGAEGYVVGNPNAIPEPSTVAILGIAGLAGLAIVRRRRQA
ncbi:PEP-CTERM sorting domain-containing protein [Aeoliella sp. SH292]|uniref:PEP-CTERM sorting domain-containing protein n=1 Tax=Aeoliella sp. SH292 TaxID=3454464 RepID=UPI003F9CBEEA